MGELLAWSACCESVRRRLAEAECREAAAVGDAARATAECAAVTCALDEAQAEVHTLRGDAWECLQVKRRVEALESEVEKLEGEKSVAEARLREVSCCVPVCVCAHRATRQTTTCASDLRMDASV